LIFTETELTGSYIIEIEKLEDERGFFARTWDQNLFKKNGLNPHLVQCDISFNKNKGTLRGMHYQIPPYEEAKLIRCTKGSIFDVIIDLRKDSKSFRQWVGQELSEHNYKMLYVPEGFAHGFQTLEDNTEVCYQMSQFYKPASAQGIRWDDKAFNIKWPLKPNFMSEKDQSYEDFLL